VIELGPNRYGKQAIRLVKVIRGPDRHDLRDLTVAVTLEGAFAEAHTAADNSRVVATDTMKNTVYAFAKEHLDGSIEEFGTVLARHFAAIDQVDRAAVSIREHRWAPIPTHDGPAPDAFLRVGDLTRIAVVTARREGIAVESGLEDLTVMKTTRSAFKGFPRDRYTTLPETDDRILATKVAATWRYESGGVAADETDLDYDTTFEQVLTTLLATFAEHHSESVQASIWIIGRAVLEAHPELSEIRMVLPNLHHWIVDLTAFGLPNDRDIFVATQEPYGLIDATVRRGD
jgi:urate oxidase